MPLTKSRPKFGLPGIQPLKSDRCEEREAKRPRFHQPKKQVPNDQPLPSFRTAHQQLVIDEKTKGHSLRPPERQNSGGGSSFVYGQDKSKNLGVPRASFKPPIPQPSPEEPVKEEVVDERYKNIDQKMIELIQNEIMDHGSPVTWNDIAGLEFVKTTVKEIVVFPLLRPDIFCGLRSPPKGILLFGPPGTGKTLIGSYFCGDKQQNCITLKRFFFSGKCIASQSKSTFFSISASSLTSKWVGEGEKMVRALFAVARVHQPSVVFIDEIDSLLSARSDTEHESSRRIKTEFLVQLVRTLFALVASISMTSDSAGRLLDGG